jgi:hypothetical protein
MKVTLLLSTSGLDESAGTPESVQLLLVGVFGEASNCSDETPAPIADRAGLGQSFETVAHLAIAVGTPITGRPPQSGRIEARTGLRMMPTSPRSPLSFRTAGFPQYGWKDGVSDGAFPTRRSVQACSRHTLTTYWFASVLRASRRIHECPAQCRVGYAPMHRRGGWVILLPRGPRSSPGCAVPVCHHLIDPIRPTRRHITTSPQGGLYAMPSLCGSA